VPAAGPTFHFVGGKGGVGKTTCSAALGLAAAATGQRVLVASTDPAPSLGDAFELRLSARPRRVASSRHLLFGAELDAAASFRRWIRQRQPLLESIARQGTWLDDEDVARLIGLSLPGIDEIAALFEIALLAESSRFDHVVIDTAPTGHTLRMLALPGTLAGVAGVFDAMRDKGRLLESALRGGWTERAEDVLIRELADTAAALHALLRDPVRTQITWVTLPEPMAISETADALAALKSAGFSVQQCVVNRRTPPPARPCPHCDARIAFELRALRQLPPAGPVLQVTNRGTEPRGIEALAGIARELAKPHGPAPPPTRTTAWRAALPGTAVDAGALIAPGTSLILVAGKGGVGKTTCAAALALAAAAGAPRRPVLLLSTDPAHSLADVLAPRGPRTTRGPRTPRKRRDISSNLVVRELDAAAAYATIRARYVQAIDAVFDRFSGAANVEAGQDRAVMKGLLDLAPPGLDELAAVLEIGDTLSADSPDRQLIVMDTAPTGHALRLLEMPSLVHDWVRALMAILLKYQTVTGLGTLGALLLDLSQRIGRLRALLADADRTAVVVVTRAAALPRLESLRLLGALRRLGVSAPFVLVNALGRGTCGLCRRDARREAEELDALRGDLRKRRPAPALLLAPAHLPPPAGAGALMDWARRWTHDGPPPRSLRYHRSR
jgi:arsenite-transporting ATPase